MPRLTISALVLPVFVACLGCGVESPPAQQQSESPERQTAGPAEEQPDPPTEQQTENQLPALSPEATTKGLMLAQVVTQRNPQGKLVPLPARLGFLHYQREQWWYETIEDPDSNVFHKAMAYAPADGPPGILTAGGTKAMLKLWQGSFAPQTLWEADFGGKFSRLRDLEVADLYGDGLACMVVATHDQGVVAVLRPGAGGVFEVEELDRQPNTIVHEVEVGDLDGDGVLEVYATPSRPNKIDGTPQPGQVVRYVPALAEGRTVVAELGNRHAKEILLDDLDGDGRDELYVAVEGATGVQVEIRRHDAGTDPAKGRPIATLPDIMCRCLTTGDLEGDGHKEMVAAAMASGVWLLRPPGDPSAPWSVECIDANSKGFEHAALLSDLDGDGKDELYVAYDKAGEVNQYLWRDGRLEKKTIHRHDADFQGHTWDLTDVPEELIP